jgi:hypothetical protein
MASSISSDYDIGIVRLWDEQRKHLFQCPQWSASP